MAYILYHKNNKVLSFTLESDYVTNVNKIITPCHIPIILYENLKATENPTYAMQEKLEQWLDLRTISASRENLKDLLKKLKVSDKDELAKKNFFLTLSDSYWVCEENQKLNWNDINFFDNYFSSYVGNVAFDKLSNVPENYRSPDTTTSGMLNKRWNL